VLDTWLVCGLFHAGWPEQTQDLAFYYPTSTLVTGFDIIFLGGADDDDGGTLYGQMPFRDVYIHGLAG